MKSMKFIKFFVEISINDFAYLPIILWMETIYNKKQKLNRNNDKIIIYFRYHDL